MGRRLLGCAVALAATLVAGAPAIAQEPSVSHLTAARELIQFTGVLLSVDELLPSFTEEIRRQSVTRPELTKDLNEVLRGLEPELALQRQQIVNQAAQSYAKFLTESVIRDAITFFKSPSGAKYAKIQPDVTDDMLNKVQAWSQEASEYFMVRTRAELAKRGQVLQ